MKKLITIFILLALGGGGTYYYYTYGKVVEKPQVVTTAVSKGAVTELVVATGTLEAKRTVPVGSQVSGTVQELFVDFNQIVHAGQVLAQIDPNLMKVQVQIQEASISQREGDIANQKVQLEDAERNYQRAKELYEKPTGSLVTKQSVEQAELTVKSRKASIDSAEKQLVSARFSLDQANLNVKYTTIVSPIDGVVINRQVDKGQTVQASTSAPTFFLLATDLTQLKLTGGVDEADIGKIRPGQRVEFRVDAYKDTMFSGTVNSVRLNAQNAQNVVTYQTVVDVENPELKLRPGMTANMSIIIQTVPDVLRVPAGALRFRPNNEIYLALGMPVPQANQGRNAGGPGATAPPPEATPTGAPGVAGAPPAATPGAQANGNMGQNRTNPQMGGGQTGGRQGGQQGGRQGGQNGARTPGAGGNRGFGAGGVTLTAEQRAAMAAQFGGGRGGGRGGGGAGGNRGNRPAANETKGPVTPITQRNAEKIDELFAPVVKTDARGTVWIYDEKAADPKDKLKQLQVRTGVSDGQFFELVAGDLQLGQLVVTGVILPIVARPGTTGNNPLMQQQRGGMGGMTPGGGGAPGGGGGRGGGGGGRGGGN